MIAEEQKELAGFLKDVHLTLRCRARQIGAEKAWNEHLKREDILRKYADSMKRLSEEYWSVNNNKKELETPLCRIKWIINCITDYFVKKDLIKEIEKEQKKMKSFLEKGLINSNEFNIAHQYELKCLSEPPYKVLDVGSCHNPFRNFDLLQVYPIDLCPATPEVKKCDFLNVTVKNTVKENWFSHDLEEIPSSFFDVIVFSLFLEYLPSPIQRYKSCLCAYKCLKENGILLIVTPDSKHATANSSLMKSWKIAAACIGFNRIRFEKLKYLHCMMFRKSISPKYPCVLYNIQPKNFNAEEMFVIPQDSISYNQEKPYKIIEKYESSVLSAFNELPFSQ